MGWDQYHGCTEAGCLGGGTHLGDPLTVEQIRELPDRAEVVITWSGGNGPHPYRVLVDISGERRVENCYADLILSRPDQRIPLHRVTVGWDDKTRDWVDGRVLGSGPHVLRKWSRLRGAVDAPVHDFH